MLEDSGDIDVAKLKTPERRSKTNNVKRVFYALKKGYSFDKDKGEWTFDGAKAQTKAEEEIKKISEESELKPAAPSLPETRKY